MYFHKTQPNILLRNYLIWFFVVYFLLNSKQNGASVMFYNKKINILGKKCISKCYELCNCTSLKFDARIAKCKN